MKKFVFLIILSFLLFGLLGCSSGNSLEDIIVHQIQNMMVVQMVMEVIKENIQNHKPGS